MRPILVHTNVRTAHTSLSIERRSSVQHAVIVHAQHRARRKLHPVLRVRARQQPVPATDRIIPDPKRISHGRVHRPLLTMARPTRRPSDPSRFGRHCSSAPAPAHRSRRVAAVDIRMGNSDGTVHPLPQRRVQG